MASNPPAACCFEGFLHEGTPKGYYKELYGLKTYIAEPTLNCEEAAKKSKKIVVILTDIYGNTLPNNCLIADDLAKQGYQVLIPDILLGDSISIKERPNIDIAVWRSKHSNEITKPIVDTFFASLKKDSEPLFLGVIGHCFGAKYAVQQVAKGSGLADCCAIAHPTMVTIDEVEAISKPILISAAETDGVFPAELRHQTEDKLKQIGSTYQMSLYGGVTHGFAVRGDISNPVVKYAKEKVLLDQIHWFNTFSA